MTRKPRPAPQPDAGPMTPSQMIERLTQMNNNLAMQVEEFTAGRMTESLSDLDWANRVDRDYLWIRASGANAPQFRYMTKETIDMYADIANFMYVYNPLINRIVNVKTQFTFALDYSITSDTGQDAIDEVKDNDLNKQAFFGHQAIADIDGELQRSGNVFIAIWPDKQQVRAWSNYEIRDIVTDPEDSTRPLFYLRSWLDDKGSEYRKAYPSVFAQPEDIPKGKTALSYLGTNYEIDRSAVVYHMSAKKGIKQKFALSELVAVCRWAKPHEKYLEDFAAIVAALRKYSHLMTTKGTASQASAIATQFKGDTEYMGTPLQSKPTGSMVVAQEGNELRVVDAGSGKIVGIEGARSFLLMVSAASGVPETYLTMDPSTGNLATAKQISPVFIMLIQERQTAWKNALTIIFKTLLESDDFEVSFPPIRDNIDAYVANMNSIARTGQGTWTGAVRAEDYIKAGYEALEWKLPSKEDIEAMAAELEAVPEPTMPPGTDQSLNQIAQAANGLMEAARRAREADDVTWITVGGQHIPIQPGQSKGDAVKQALGGKGGSGDSGSSSGKSSGTSDISDDEGSLIADGAANREAKQDGYGFADSQESNFSSDVKDYGNTSYDESRQLREYTEEQYEYINSALRSGNFDKSEFGMMQSEVDGIIDGAPAVPEGVTLYRGVGVNSGEAIANAEIGSTFTDAAYQSHSLNPATAAGFAKEWGDEPQQTVIRVVTSGKERGVYLNSEAHYEHEMIFARDSSWKIIGKETRESPQSTVHVVTVVRADD